MHITLCTDGVFPQALGGMQRHSRLLAEHLAQRPGIRLSVIHPHEKGIFDRKLGIDEEPIAPIDPTRNYFRELWRYSARVSDRLVELRPDVIISQGFSVWKNIDRFSSRLIVHPHGLEMFQATGTKERIISIPFRLALRSIMRRSRVTISLGGKLSSIIEEQLKGSRSELVSIPNAVDVPSAPLPYPPEGSPLKVLFVGRFAFNKGIDVLMEAAQFLQRPGDVRFLLAGDGPLLDHYRSKGLPPNVELLGRVDDDRLEKAYAECHALVLPTRFEGMPTVVLEAMARARPVFVSDVGATAELVDERNGFLLPKGDPKALAKAIDRFMEMDHAGRTEMGLIGFARARDHYRWPVIAEQFHRLAQRIALNG